MDKKFEQCMSAMREECDKALKGMDSELLLLAEDLLDLCKNLLFDQDISLAIAMIFDRENGIFSIVERLIPARDRNIQKSREKLLTLVAEFIKMIGQKVIPYTLLVKKSCLDVFHRDDSRSVQAAALVPLLSLFEFNSQSKGCSDAAIDWTTVETMLLQYKKAKTSGSLRSNILTTLGCTVESFPSFYTESNVSSLLKLCLDTLEEQLHKSGRDLSYVLISGAVKCLDSLLTWFDDTLPAGGSVENSRRSYLYLEQVIHYREDLRRYDIAKAGLRLLGRHASRFRIAVFENSLEIMKWLHAYCLHNNSDLRAAALPAYDAFLSQVASCLLSEDARIKHAHQIYKSLLTEILKILDSPDKLPKLTSIAIRAVGKLSSAIVKYSGNDSLKQAFERLMPFASTFRRGEAGHEELGYSITLVGAFASIILHLGKVEDSMVSLVTEVTGNIFYQFPFLFPKQKQAVYPTLSSLLKSLFQKGAIFSLFLSNVVWSSLERTMEATVEEPEGVRLPLWPHYVELWCHILDLRSDGTDSFAIIDKEENLSGIVAFNIGEVNVNIEELRSLIFDTLMRNIMKAMSELNLKYKVRVPDKEDQNRIAAGDNEDKEIEAEAGIIEPLDVFQMRKFLNLVEFVQGILSSQHAPLLLKWTYTFGRFLVELSVHYPLISGFYKILATTISVADRQGYFKAMDNVKDNEINETVRVEVDERCYSLFSAYLKDVLVRSRRYKLELLVACLQLCLSAPHALLDIPSLLGPTKRALQIGLRYSPIATVAIDALERWQDAYPEELQVHLYEIVPYLSNYLFEIIPTVHPKSVKMAMSSNRSGQRDGSQLNSFEDLQVKIQQFLGRIGKYSHYLVPDINLLQASGTGGLAWDTIDQVKFTLPFRDEKFDTYLDSLLSRIAELALSSTDRKTKVVSCELLHAVCLFMLGSSAKGPVQKRNSQAHSSSVKYDKLYRKIFPVILQLATDLDLVTQQLFGSFSKQLIHWMTSNTQRENPETMALLDAILDGLVDVEKGSLREFSADCFGEFLLWSVRHTAPEANDFVNVTSMLDRLYNRMGHPSPYHRLGAAMAVHRIYPVLRGHASIVERYILELSFFCLKSLRLAEDDHEHIGTIKQINKAIDGILKLIIRNLVALQKPRKNRPMFTNLEEFLEWLLLQSSQLLVNCRTRCMHMLSVICRELEGGSCSYWFQTKFSSIKRIEYLVNIFDVHSTSEGASSDENRLKFLHCAFQWTGWALREKLISIDELASVMKNPSYNICIIIESFISKILDQASPHNQLDETFGNSLKGSTIFSFLSLVKEALHLEIGLKEENDFRSLGLGYVLPLKSNLLSQALMVNQGKFLHMLCIILLHPAGLGISHSQTSRRGLAELAVTLLWWLTRTCMDFKEGLIEVLHQLFEVGDLSYGASYFQQIFEQGLLSLKPQNIPNMLDLVNGYQSLHLVGVLVPALAKSKAKELGAQLLTSAYNIQKDIPPSLETIAAELLTLSFCLGVELEEVLNLVSESEFEIKVGNVDRNLTKGAIFYLNFRKILIQQVKFSYQRCLHYLIGQSVHNQSCKLLLEALLEDYLCKKGASITTGSFVLEFLKHMQLLKHCCSVEASLGQREFLLNIMYKLLLVDKSSVLCQNNPSFHFFIESSFFFLEFGNTHGLSSKDYVTTLSQKCKALLLVPFLATVSDEVCGRLVETLTRLVTNHLLVEDAELPSGSNLRANFLQLLDTLLKCITAASKIGFLEVLFPLLQNPKKITFKPVVQALEDIAGNIEETLPAFTMCLQLLHDSSKLPRLRRSVIDNFFVPLVHSSSIDFVVMWYAEHIGHIVDLISKPIDHDAMDRESEEEKIQVRISHYTILDVLFMKVDGQIIKEKLSPLVSNQQLMKLSSNESRAKNDPVLYRFPENVILWRDLHVSAYSCLASVMMRTQEQEKLFTILFKDYAGNPLWQHLIDCTKVYKKFPVETSQSQMFSDIVKGIRLESKSRREVSTDISFSTQYAYKQLCWTQKRG